MLYLFCGADRDQARKRFHQVIDLFKQKNPTGDIFRFEPMSFTEGAFAELITGRGLFEQKLLIGGVDLLSQEPSLEFIAQRIPELAASFNTFVFLEDEPPPELLRQIKRQGGRVTEFNLKKSSPPPSFNVFKLTDALGERNRQKLWLLFQEALSRGVAPEEIFWKLVWQTKMILLFKNLAGQNATTVKPFVAFKSSRYGRNFEKEEIERISSSFVALWHDAKRGFTDFEIGLERLVLSI